jgi:hypothetical protein
MAAGKWKVYEQSKIYLLDGTFDLDDTANWKMGLYLSTSNANDLTLAAPILANITNEHANANGYLTGGVAVAGQSLAKSGGTTTFDLADGAWTAAGGSIVARFAIVYKNATVNSIVKPVLMVCLLDTTPADVTTTTGNPFTVQINASGALTLSGADSN